MAINIPTQPTQETTEKNTAVSTISYETYLANSSETAITEWVEGEVITYMPPTNKHQVFVWFLNSILSFFVNEQKLGELRTAPFEVKLWPGGPSREPDLLFISQTNLDKLDEKRFNGAPDLVVEIVSASSVREDKSRKFQEYEQAGVREYWLIDPRPHLQTVEVFTLNEVSEYEPIEISDEGIIHTAVLPGFWLDVNWFTQEPLPNAQRIAYEIMLSLEHLAPEIRSAYQTLHTALTAHAHDKTN